MAHPRSEQFVRCADFVPEWHMMPYVTDVSLRKPDEKPTYED
jgi:hypothetical protein